MRYNIKAISVLELDFIEGTNYSEHIQTVVGLELGENLDRSGYFEKGTNNLTKNGCIAITNCFVQGLVSSIHMAHQIGHRFIRKRCNCQRINR